MSKGNQYTIEMISNELNSVLRVENEQGIQLAMDGGSGRFRDVKIEFSPPVTGTYHIIATSFDDGIGKYTLKVTPKKGKIMDADVPPTIYVMFPMVENGKTVFEKKRYDDEILTNGENYLARVLAADESRDLALLKLKMVSHAPPALPLARNGAQPAETVYSLGNPGASDVLWVHTSGTVRTSAYQKKWQAFGVGGTLSSLSHNTKIIETQAPTNTGDSGGPMVNEFGELVAVTQGILRQANAISLFVDISEVRKFLEERGYRWIEGHN